MNKKEIVITEGKLTLLICIMLAIAVCVIGIKCTNTPAREETVAVDSSYLIDPSDKIIRGATNVMSFSRSISGSTVIRSVLSSGDTMVITYTPSSYVASKLDTVIKRKASVPVSTPPVDTVTHDPSGGYGTLIYSSGYDGIKDLDPFGNNQFGGGSISTTVYKTGPGSFHSVPLSVSSGIRSEVQYPSSLTPSEGVIEWDVMYVRVQQDNIHSLQIHPNTSGGSASPGLWHINGQFYWVNWKGGMNTKYATGVTIQSNHWYHMVFEYKYGSAGYMKFTIDGKVVLDKTGIQVNDGSGGYLKVGTNSWNGTNSEVYYDNLRLYKK